MTEKRKPYIDRSDPLWIATAAAVVAKYAKAMPTASHLCFLAETACAYADELYCERRRLDDPGFAPDDDDGIDVP